MNEIAELQQLLQQAQARDSSFKLSERNVIELISTIQQQSAAGLLPELLFTVDGKEYVTRQQLKKEIFEVLNAEGGRLNRIDIPAILRVDIHHIDQLCDEIVVESAAAGAGGRIIAVHGQLITEEFLDGVVMELNETLQEHGSVTMSDLIAKLNLPSDFLFKEIKSRLGRLISAKIEGDTLFTSAFLHRQKAILRGCLTAATMPVSLSEVINRYKLYEALVEGLVRELIAEKWLSGVVSKGTFIPTVYEAAVVESIVQFFNQNGYIEYSRIIKTLSNYSTNVDSAKQFISQRCPNCVLLENFAASETLRDTLDDSLEGAATSNTTFDVMSLLPPQFTEADTRLLIDTCTAFARVRDNLIICAGIFAVPRKKIEDIARRFEAKVIHDTQHHLSTQQSQQASKKGSVAESESRRLEAALTKALPSRSDLISAIKSELRDEAPSPSDVSIYQAIISEVHSVLRQAAMTQATSSRTIAKERSTIVKRQQLQQLESAITELYHELLCYIKGVAFFRNIVIASSLERQLLRSECTLLVELVLQEQAVHNDIPLAGYLSRDGSITNMNALLSALPDNVSRLCQPLVESLKKGINAFMAQLDATCEGINLLLRMPDKKTEKHILQAKKVEFRRQVEIETDPPEFLIAVCQCLFAEIHGIVIWPTGKLIELLIGALRSSLSRPMNTLLADTQKLVSQYIMARRANQPTENFTDARLLEEKLRQLREAVLGLSNERAAAADPNDNQ